MIRSFLQSDTENVLSLFRLNTPAYFSPDEEQHFQKYLLSDSEHYLVFETEDGVVGSGGANYFLPEKIVRISWDMVHPDHHSKGIGSSLLHHRLKLILKNPEVNKVVVRTSQMACKFYAKCGFKMVCCVKDYWAKGFDLYEMEMETDQIHDNLQAQ